MEAPPAGNSEWPSTVYLKVASGRIPELIVFPQDGQLKTYQQTAFGFISKDHASLSFILMRSSPDNQAKDSYMMDVGVDKGLLRWLSRLDEADIVKPQEEGRSYMDYTFEGVPVQGQNIPTNNVSSDLPSLQHTKCRHYPSLERQSPVHPHQFELYKRGGKHSRSTRNLENGYERIPRSKPRENRYEYKGKIRQANEKDIERVHKKRSTKQKRKQTINEDFHASNVPRSRLTLLSSRNMGVFSRGKTSPPVNPHGWPKDSFSERAFLKGQPHSMGKDQPMQHEEDISVRCHSSDDYAQPARAYSSNACFNSPIQRGESEEHGRSFMFSSNLGQNELNPSSECALQMYTMQLLNFDLSAPYDDNIVDPSKKYWTLTELKYLLEQRIPSWNFRGNTSLIPASSSSKHTPRKRKRDASEDETAIGESPRKARKLDTSQKSESSLINNTTILDPQSISAFPSSLRQEAVGIVQDGRISLQGQINHAMECGSVHCQRQYKGENTSFICNKEVSLMSQAFDAAYEAIMQSKWDASYDFLDSVPAETESICSSEGYATSVLQNSCDWVWEKQRPLNSSRIRQEIHLSHNEGQDEHLNPTGPGRLGFQPLYSRTLYTDRELPFSTSQDRVLGLRESCGIDDLTENALAVNIDSMKDFWRQNRLY
ncbi:hypothetical protein P175DRAFT_0560751 [Aspergillus ochraceoroseus IBT 24754]|uniref:Uncharacterized protein n=1 Tax=Aspergillus ochraceoroseus IBT 24754 TaxID=1392256 RepID=A0A2T5LML9_9EURO|nr:uncharacterized protein P175DRAFT_0560751 [Aspergillus ochraceoroseus IBT 24754]PTU17524.1 hypothetical protein P175DRAFT_0560751 [Aspergillus ochraceoroseus IBT 24754]